jgi:molecular chaperone GrpE (heat shock protein)
VPTEDEQGVAESPAAQVDDAGESAKSDLALLVERLAGEVAGLRAEFAAKIRYDQVKERQIASMHEELQGFRTGLHLRLLQPVFTDLITLHDDLADAMKLGAAGELASYKESVLETLSRNGVSSYSVATDEIDRVRQRVIRVVSTGDETRDGRVQQRVRDGFEYDNGKVLRPEWVVAYRYTRNTEEEVAAVSAAGGE